MRALLDSLVVRRARLVPLGHPVHRDTAWGGTVGARPQGLGNRVSPGRSTVEPVDLRIVDGVVTEIAPALVPGHGERVVDVAGRWVMPGLWDHHVHLLQWAQLSVRIDTSGTNSPGEVLDLVRAHLRDSERRSSGDPAGQGGSAELVVGVGHRIATWTEQPTTAALDAVVGDRPVVLVSGDVHHGWLSSAAMRLLGLAPRAGIVAETEWFEAYARLGALPAVRAQGERAIAGVVARAAALGVVGITDFEFGGAYADWPSRTARGITGLRVRAATYADGLDDVIARGWRTGDALDSTGLVQMGPLKIIADGSLGTRTAYCCQPYLGTGLPAAIPPELATDPSGDGLNASAGASPLRGPSNAPMEVSYGVLNTPPEELRALLTRAHAAGLEVAIHAIGDAAVGCALDAFAATGARGSIEHAQLVAHDDIARMARLGLTASVQPAHLIDDRDTADVCWADRTDRCFPLRAMADAGVRMVFGSDAPVSPLDPWLEIATAVRRSGDERGPWHPEQALTVAEALAASTDGRGTVGVGSPADLVVLDADPLGAVDPPQSGEGAEPSTLGRTPSTSVAATLVGGAFTHNTLD
ncbi:MAG: amidohydrolase family protein [Propionibacteriaceae bacterium]|nr:amidohydrolase family protein [Propionibacteriaceae bacterium]